ncbi:hypothetical protein DRH13_00935 [Candidatus Woesebacteria bacterium]|nr:MAG: hypothetical protein DRH13_00935 [Candidatus Woesebacteria bacterium]
MSKAESWLLTGWEPKVAKQEESLCWMKKEYEASSVEVGLEAMMMTLTLEIGNRLHNGLNDEDLSEKMAQLLALAKDINTMPARRSLSEKHTRYTERNTNGKII